MDFSRSHFSCNLPSLTRQGFVYNAVFYSLPNNTFVPSTTWPIVSGQNTVDYSTFLNMPTGKRYNITKQV